MTTTEGFRVYENAPCPFCATWPGPHAHRVGADGEVRTTSYLRLEDLRRELAS